jgi:two-component system response regulator FixJ
MTRPTVIVVDDEPLITSMLGMILDLSLDADVITLNSPVKVCELLQKQTASLLITDYLMPEFNGIQLVRTIREQGIMIPVVLLTGYCDEPELIANSERLKPFEVIVKPWDNEYLVKRINALLGRS